MGDWQVLPMPTTPSSNQGWEVLPMPEQKPNVTKTGGWEVLPGHPSAFQEGPQKRLIDISSSFPRVQRYMDLLQTGGAQFVGSLGSLAEGLGPTPEIQNWGESTRKASEAYTTPAMSLEQMGSGYDKVDWTSPADVLSWAGNTATNIPKFIAENVVTQVPQIGATAVAAAGAVAAAPEALASAAGLGGMFAVNYLLNAGETFAGLREKGVSRDAATTAAGFVGGAKAILDTALPAKLGGQLAAKLGTRMFWVPKDVLGKAPSLAKALMSGSLIEGGTEAGQELLDMWSEMQQGVYTPGQGLSRVLNSAAAGAAGGLVFSGMEHYVPEHKAEVQADAEAPPIAVIDNPPPDAIPSVRVNDPIPPSPGVDVADPVAVLKDKFAQLGGENSLLSEHSEGDVRKILGIDKVASLKFLEDKGIFERTKDGNYKLTQDITDTIPPEPLPQFPGVTKSADGKVYNYVSPTDPTKAFRIDFVPADPAVGNDDQFTTVVDGEMKSSQFLEDLIEQVDPEFSPITLPEPFLDSSIALAETPSNTVGEISASTITPQKLSSRSFEYSPVIATKLELEHVKKAFGNSVPVVEGSDGSFIAEGVGGGHLKITPGLDHIDFSPEDFLEGYGRELTPDDVVVGSYQQIGRDSLIKLSTRATLGTLRHELFHAAMRLVLTNEERGVLLSRYTDEESAARAYEGRDENRLFTKIKEFFSRLLEAFFGANRPETTMGRIASGEVWRRFNPTAEPGTQYRSGPPTAIPSNDRSASKEMASVNKLIRNLPKDAKERIQDSYGRLFKYVRHAEFLTQLQDQFPNNALLKQFVNLTRLAKQEKVTVQLEAQAVAKEWISMGIKGSKKVSELVRLVERESLIKGRRLMMAEVRSLALPLAGDTNKIMEMWETIDGSMVKALDMLEKAMTDEARRTLGVAADLMIWDIQKQLEPLRKRNYFPATRFGEWGVLVKTTAPMLYKGKAYSTGQTVVFETAESEKGGEELGRKLREEFGARGDVFLRKITPTEQSFLNMPAALADFLHDHMDLTPEQFAQLKQLQYSLAPGQGMVKHLVKKSGVFGATNDTLRAYTDYYQKLSGHIAKIKTSAQIEDVLGQAGREARLQGDSYLPQLVVEAMNTNYKDNQSYGNELGAMAGGIFHLVFGFNPLAAVVNLTQVPVFTYPYLAKRSNDLIATRAIGAAMAKVGGTFKSLAKGDNAKSNAVYSGEDKIFFDRAVDEGFLNESLAGEIAAMASGGMFSKYFEGGAQADQQLRWLLGKSTMFFSIAEEFNRRVTFQAGLEVGRTQGLTGENLYEFARKAVDLTQFEYSRWNRPHMMRGKASILFVFKAYLQNFMYFAGTNQGGMRFWLMMTALAGLKGVPGSDDLMDIIDLLGTWGKSFFGMKNPKVDSQRMARDFVNSIGMNPDLAMNGLARYSFGLAGLEYFFGIPFPAADFSSSLQINRFVPGIRMVKGMSEGTMKWGDAFNTLFNDVVGAAGSTGQNLTRAILDDTPSSIPRLLQMSSVTRNVSRAFDMATKGSYRSPDGSALIDVDMTKPEHLGEIVMQFLGKRPTRAAKAQEARAMDREQIAYYIARRDMIITHWAQAIGNKDAEARETARKEYVKFAQTAPPEFVFGGDQVRAELVRLVKGRALKDLGLPAQAKYIKMAQDTDQAFGITR